MKINPRLILEQGIIYVAEGMPPISIEEQCQQNGVDLRLFKAQRFVGSAELYVDKKRNRSPQLVEMDVNNNCYQFKAGEQYSVTFMEDVKVPSGMCSLVIHRSTINRGIGTLFSGIFDSGFESLNGCGATFRPIVDVKIEVGTRLAQITFDAAEEASLYNGTYQKT